jgi:HAD superfamily hydrolase (TIGR01450 family)
MGPSSGEPSSAASAFARASLWLIDLDGVVWLSGRAIGKGAAAITALRQRGIRVAFATNNSAPTTDQLIARLAKVGVSADASDLVTSAMAAASLLESGQAVGVLAEAGVHEALDRRGIAVAEGDAQAAVVGWNRTFDYQSLSDIASVARRTGRLIGTNDDPVYPTPDGPIPGSGALLAAVTTASGVVPEIAGKPHEPMASLMRDTFGFESGDASVVMVGDQPKTDGRLAARLGIAFALVDSGVTPADASGFDVPVVLRSADLGALVDTVFA